MKSSRIRGFWRHPVTILAAAFLLRLIFALPNLLDNGGAAFARPDTAGYWEIGEQLCRDGEMGELTRRVPGYPALIALALRLTSDPANARIMLVLLGIIASTLTVLIIYYAAEKFRADTGVAAAYLAALNLTAIANAPMLLTDTVFALIIAAQLLLTLEFHRSGLWRYYYAAIILAALGTLFRPINLFWIFPLTLLLWLEKAPDWRRKLGHTCGGLLCFAALLFGQFYHNYRAGAGWTIDTNTGAVYHQNGAMLRAELYHSDFEIEKELILREQEAEFADTEHYPDERSREAYRLRCYRQLVLAHFPLWLKQQCNFRVLLPDAATLCENLRLTTPNRGTMGVLSKHGLAAAVKHYFGGRTALLYVLSPLLLIALATYLGAGAETVRSLFRPEPEYSRWYLLALLGAFIVYYLWLPGAIGAPRYQLPALPLICVLAAGALRLFRPKTSVPATGGDKRRHAPNSSPGKAVRKAAAGRSRAGK